MSQLARRDLIKLAVSGASAGIFGIPWEAAAQMAKGGVLVIGSTQRPRHLNPGVQSGTATMVPGAQIFASPLRMDANWKPQPYLAERWDLSPDFRSVTLQLRKDAVFHDGRPITTEDLKFSIELVRDNHPFKSMYAPVNAVTISDAHTAVVRLSQPHPALLLAMSTSLTPILPKHIFGDGVDPKVHPRNNNPVGSGPFKVVEFKPDERLVLERFDKFFFKDAPKLERIIIQYFKDPSSMLLAFERGEIDTCAEFIDAREVERVRKVPGVQALANSGPAIGPLVWLAFNTKNPKLADKRVRQAISYAIDRKFVIDSLLGKLHKRSTGPIASGSPFYSADVQHYELDLAKSAKLLDEAGLKPSANGVRLALDLDCIPGTAATKTIQEYLKPALAKVGIEVNVRFSPDFPSWARRVAGGQFDMSLDVVYNWGDPVIGVHRTWLTSNIKPGVIWSNTQGYSNPKVDELLDAASQEMNLTKRKAMYKEFQKLVVDDCPCTFLFETTFTGAYRGNVQNPPNGIWGISDAILSTSMKS